MEAACKNILDKNVSNPLLVKSRVKLFKITQKTKSIILSTLFIFILVGTPIGIEYLLKSSYIISFFAIVVIYPLLVVTYKMNRRMTNCKYMP